MLNIQFLFFTYSVMIFLLVAACSSNRADRRCTSEGRSAAYETALSEKYLTISQANWSLATQMLPTRLPLLSITGEELFLSDLLSRQKILIFRYSYMHCQTCVRETLDILNTFYEQDSTQQIYVLATYAYFDHFAQFCDSTQYKLTFFLLPNSYAVGPLEMSRPPFLFLTDSSRHIMHPFIPFEQLSGGTSAYLTFLHSHIFSSILE